MKHEHEAAVRLVGRLVRERVGEKAGDLHLVKPAHEFETEGEARLPIPVVDFDFASLQRTEPPCPQHQDRSRLDLHRLRRARTPGGRDDRTSRPVRGTAYREPRQIEEDRAPDDAAPRNRLYAGFRHSPVRRGGRISIPERIIEPHVAERVAVGAGLSEAAHVVVSEFEPSRQRPPVARLESRLVRDHVVPGRPASGKDRISGRRRNRHPEGERTAALDSGDS